MSRATDSLESRMPALPDSMGLRLFLGHRHETPTAATPVTSEG